MAVSANPRLGNLLASLALNLAEEGQQALEHASGLMGSATVALLALEEFLGGAHVGRLAHVLGLTHSGAVRLVTQLEHDGLAERHQGADRRRVEVQLTAKGQRQAHAARAARDDVIAAATSGLTIGERDSLEALLDKLVSARVASRVERRRGGRPMPGGAAPATSPPAVAPRAVARRRRPRRKRSLNRLAPVSVRAISSILNAEFTATL